MTDYTESDLDTLRFARHSKSEGGDAREDIRRIASQEGDGGAFEELMVQFAEQLSGCTYASKSANFEMNPPHKQKSRRLRDPDTRWGAFRLSRPDWRSLFMSYPGTGITALVPQGNVSDSLRLAPWMSTEHEELLYPIRRYLQVWWKAKDNGWPLLYARRIVAMWYYSRYTALELLKVQVPSSATEISNLWLTIVEDDLHRKVAWLNAP